jgi:hypothetical protein
MKRLTEEALQKKKQKDVRGNLRILIIYSDRCNICFEKEEDVGEGRCQA